MTPATVRMPWTTVSSVSAGPCDLVVVGKADPRGPASNGAGDRSRSSLRAGIRLGRDPSYRLVLDGRSEHPAMHRLKGTDFGRRALEFVGDDRETRANAAVALS